MSRLQSLTRPFPALAPDQQHLLQPGCCSVSFLDGVTRLPPLRLCSSQTHASREHSLQPDLRSNHLTNATIWDKIKTLLPSGGHTIWPDSGSHPSASLPAASPASWLLPEHTPPPVLVPLPWRVPCLQRTSPHSLAGISFGSFPSGLKGHPPRRPTLTPHPAPHTSTRGHLPQGPSHRRCDTSLPDEAYSVHSAPPPGQRLHTADKFGLWRCP